MKLTITEVLRRGLDNTLANWQIIVIRVLTVVALFAITIGVVILAIVPLLVGAGISKFDDPEAVAASIVESLATAWIIFLYILVILSIAFLVAMLVYSFIEAGCARVYIDGDRAAGASPADRSRYRVYSFDRWWEAAKDGGWTVFWIYNLVWGVTGLILLIPLVPTFIGMLIARGKPEALACIGCVGIIGTLLLMIPLMLIASVWSEKAIVVAMARDCGARDAIRTAWREVKIDVARHVIVAVAMIAVSFVGSSIFSGFDGAISMMSGSLDLTVAFLPLRFVLWTLSSGFGAAAGGWMLASFAALSPEPRA